MKQRSWLTPSYSLSFHSLTGPYSIHHMLWPLLSMEARYNDVNRRLFSEMKKFSKLPSFIASTAVMLVNFKKFKLSKQHRIICSWWVSADARMIFQQKSKINERNFNNPYKIHLECFLFPWWALGRSRTWPRRGFGDFQINSNDVVLPQFIRLFSCFLCSSFERSEPRSLLWLLALSSRKSYSIIIIQIYSPTWKLQRRVT